MKKTAGWLWAWLREYADSACLGAGIGCTVMFGLTWWLPFVAAAVVLLCLAPVIRGISQRRRLRDGWSDGHPAVRAAAKREIALLYEWWELPAAGDEVRKEQGSE